jgi:hypothetical protein
MPTNLKAAQIIRRGQLTLADANNEVEAELRTDLVIIDETLVFVKLQKRPQLAAEIE